MGLLSSWTVADWAWWVVCGLACWICWAWVVGDCLPWFAIGFLRWLHGYLPVGVACIRFVGSFWLGLAQVQVLWVGLA